MHKNYNSKLDHNKTPQETKSQKKQLIRTHMLKIRAGLTPDFIKDSEKNSLRLISDFIDEIVGKKSVPLTIMSYMSFKNEFPTVALNNKIINSTHKLVLPLTDADFDIHAFYIDSIDELRRSHLNILEPDPKTCRKANLNQIDIMFMPGLAFDKKGSRIGFGKGCYDRFLSNKKHNIILAALAYDFQIKNNIPSEPTDIPCDYIITEKEILTIEPKQVLLQI